MKLTLGIDDFLLDQARRLAEERQISIDELIGQQLEELANKDARAAFEALEKLWSRTPALSDKRIPWPTHLRAYRFIGG